MKGSWPERRQRHAVRLEAIVSRADGSEQTAVVTDLSLDGCCLSGGFVIGEQLTLKLPKIGVLAGVVRWSFLGRSGVRFISDLDTPEGGGEADQ